MPSAFRRRPASWAMFVLVLLFLPAGPRAIAAQDTPPAPGRSVSPDTSATRDAPPLPLGTRVRVHVDPPEDADRLRFVGRLAAWDGTALSVEDEILGPTRVPLSDVRAVERSRGVHGRPLRGALIGGAIGVGAAVGLAAIAIPTCGYEDSACIASWIIIAPALGLLVGAGTGALIGRGHRAERWDGVDPVWWTPHE